MRKIAFLLVQEELSAVLGSIGDGVITTDRDSKITRMNPVAEKLTGWRENHAKGKYLDTIFKIVHEKTEDEVVQPKGQKEFWTTAPPAPLNVILTKKSKMDTTFLPGRSLYRVRFGFIICTIQVRVCLKWNKNIV